MNAIEEARDRRLSASVAEAMHGVDEDLVTRIAARLTAEAPPKSRRALFAAALLLFGTGIAATVGHLVSKRDCAAATQDPQPAALAKVTTAGCKSATITTTFKEAEAHDALVAIAREVDVPIVIASAVRGTVTLEAEQKPWREVLEQAAAMVGGSMQEYGNAILVTTRPQTTKPGARVKLRAPRMPFQSFVLTIATAANANVIIAPDIGGDLDVDLDQVPWRSALDGAAAALGAEVVGAGSVLVVRKPVPDQRSRASIKFTRKAVGEVMDLLAHMHSWNLIIHPTIQGGVTVQTFRGKIEVLEVLRAITAAVDAQVTETGRSIRRVEPLLPMAATPLALRGEALSVQQLRELTKTRNGWEVTVAGENEAKLWLFAPTARADEVWGAIAVTTGRKVFHDEKGWRLE